MRFARYAFTLLLIVSFAPSVLVCAQDDFDLDALLQDLEDSPVAEEAAASDAPEPAAEIEAAPADDIDAALDEVDAMFEESVDATEDMVEEVEEAADDLVDSVMETAPETDAASSFDDEAAALEAELESVVDDTPFDGGLEDDVMESAIMEDEPVVAEPMMEEDIMVEEVVPDEPTTIEEILQAEDDAMPEDVELIDLGDMGDADMIDEPVEVMADEAVGVMEDDMAVVDEPFDDEARALAEQERVRRQANELEGVRALEEGEAALRAEDYAGAIKKFDRALSALPDRPATAELRGRASWGHAEANYDLAVRAYKSGNLQDASSYLEKAARQVPDHRKVNRLMKRIDREEARLAGKIVPPDELPEIVEKNADIKELLLQGKQYYKIGEFNSAEALFESVLIKDEYNTTAMRFLQAIEEKKTKIRTKERDASVADMIEAVRDAWNPPIREEVQLPPEITGNQGGKPIGTSAQENLRKKMADIKIQAIEFRQANIHDVVEFLVQASIENDPEKQGVNIILNLNVPGQEEDNFSSAPVQEPVDEFQDLDEFDEFFQDTEPAPQAAPQQMAPMAGGGAVRTITLNLRRVSLLDAIRYITEVAGLKFRIEEAAVIITPANVPSGQILTRLYPVQPSILDVIVQTEEETDRGGGDFVELGSGRSTFKRGDVREFFERAGVPFPAGTYITYNPSISQLIVRNTAENLEIFERILSQLNVIPNQVEIEARFVEVNQTDLNELGLEWILNDDYEFAQKKNGAPLAGQERLQVNEDSDGLTKGLRFFGFNDETGSAEPLSAVTRGLSRPLGDILSISGVLTNPELTVVLHALSAKGNSDLLSAPRVTTRSGVNAQIEVVQEIIYPTEFEVTQPTIQSDGDLVTPPTVTPGAFETRETGVILNVTPTVGPDGYTIDLTLIPEVADLVDWIQYGSSVTLPTGGDDRTFTFNIPQPIFASRNVTTSIVIWDGQTVVMGGLIKENLVTVDDRIPVLGDIPLLGRLFRTEGESSQKQNLLIFVTARLVDPAGHPIHKADMIPGSTAAASTADIAAP